MIESGLTLLVNADSAVKAIAPIGGFLAELPKDQALPSWSYLWASDTPRYAFEGLRPVNQRRLQIDCYGGAAEVINLAQAIDNVLSGFKGTLADVDATMVAGCFRSNVIDFFDDAPRTYRRTLEYVIWFYQ